MKAGVIATALTPSTPKHIIMQDYKHAKLGVLENGQRSALLQSCKSGTLVKQTSAHTNIHKWTIQAGFKRIVVGFPDHPRTRLAHTKLKKGRRICPNET